MNPNPLDVTWHWWVRFAQTSCVLLCAYVAAYYATVRPYPKNIFWWGSPPWHTYEIGGYPASKRGTSLHSPDLRHRSQTTPRDVVESL
jgi:hypothetical protein